MGIKGRVLHGGVKGGVFLIGLVVHIATFSTWNSAGDMFSCLLTTGREAGQPSVFSGTSNSTTLSFPLPPTNLVWRKWHRYCNFHTSPQWKMNKQLPFFSFFWIILILLGLIGAGDIKKSKQSGLWEWGAKSNTSTSDGQKVRHPQGDCERVVILECQPVAVKQKGNHRLANDGRAAYKYYQIMSDAWKWRSI